MEEKDVVKLLQHQRHDLMNHLQIIQGYTSMENTEKVKAKIATWMDYFNEERKLFGLKAPLFTLWVIQFNNLHTNVRLTYRIHIESKDLQAIDQQLVNQCQQLIACMTKTAGNQELYEGSLELNESPNSSIININFSMDGHFPNVEKLKSNIVNMKQNYPVRIQEKENGITCNFSISCN